MSLWLSRSTKIRGSESSKKKVWIRRTDSLSSKKVWIIIQDIDFKNLQIINQTFASLFWQIRNSLRVENSFIHVNVSLTEVNMIKFIFEILTSDLTLTFPQYSWSWVSTVSNTPTLTDSQCTDTWKKSTVK